LWCSHLVNEPGKGTISLKAKNSVVENKDFLLKNQIIPTRRGKNHTKYPNGLVVAVSISCKDNYYPNLPQETTATKSLYSIKDLIKPNYKPMSNKITERENFLINFSIS